MKKILLSLAIAASSASAWADPIPQGVESAIKTLSLQTWSYKQGALRLVMDKRLVTPQFYSTAVMFVCGEQYREPDSFKRMKLERIEVLNSIDAQGFALLDADSQCRKLGKAKGDEGEALIQAAAVRCEAGVCRLR